MICTGSKLGYGMMHDSETSLSHMGGGKPWHHASEIVAPYLSYDYHLDLEASLLLDHLSFYRFSCDSSSYAFTLSACCIVFVALSSLYELASNPYHISQSTYISPHETITQCRRR
jgi:hypothetical protein